MAAEVRAWHVANAVRELRLAARTSRETARLLVLYQAFRLPLVNKFFATACAARRAEAAMADHYLTKALHGVGRRQLSLRLQFPSNGDPAQRMFRACLREGTEAERTAASAYG